MTISAPIFETFEKKLATSLALLVADFNSIRSGRAHPSLLERVKVEVYGQQVPLKSVASISVPDATSLLVTVWDASQVGAVERALRTPGAAALEFNPRLEGNKLFIPLPPITQERRNEFIKLAKQKAEQNKITIRGVRRTANEALKAEEKAGALSEDQLAEALKKIQTLTDQAIAKVEKAVDAKQKELENI